MQKNFSHAKSILLAIWPLPKMAIDVHHMESRLCAPNVEIDSCNVPFKAAS